MTRTLSWKRLLAVPATLALALGGALLTAAPATAAPGDDLVVTSPAATSTQTSTTFAVTGTASDGATITITDDGGVTVGSAVAVPGGAFTATVTLVDAVTTPQTLVVAQVPVAGDPAPVVTEVTLVVNLDLPVVPTPFALVSPADGADIPSRFVDFEGTAPAGATVTATVNGEEGFGSVFAADDGTFAFQGYFPFELGNDVTVVVTATQTDGTALTPETVTLSLLEPVAPPVITSPPSGSVITGGTVTFSGTGIAGNTVVVTVGPDAATSALIFDDDDFDFAALVPSTVVAPNGTWTVSTTLPLGGYTAAALHTETPIDSVDSEVISLPSNEVPFTLVAAAIAPAATGGRAELAATGAVTSGFATPAALVILAGLGMLVMSRRRLAVTA